VKVSLYKRSGRVLIVAFMNLGDRHCYPELALDLAALEERTSLAAYDVLTDALLALETGKLSVPVGAMELRVV
jgi:hypothetical protein